MKKALIIAAVIAVLVLAGMFISGIFMAKSDATLIQNSGYRSTFETYEIIMTHRAYTNRIQDWGYKSYVKASMPDWSWAMFGIN